MRIAEVLTAIVFAALITLLSLQIGELSRRITELELALTSPAAAPAIAPLAGETEAERRARYERIYQAARDGAAAAAYVRERAGGGARDHATIPQSSPR